MKKLLTVMFIAISTVQSGYVAAKTATVVAKYTVDRGGISTTIVGAAIATNDCGGNVSTLITDNTGKITKQLEWTTSSTSCAAHLTLYSPPLCSDGKTPLNIDVTGGTVSFVDVNRATITSYNVPDGDTQDMTIEFTDAGGVCPAQSQPVGIDGVVYYDANGNGTRDAGETLLDGVSVKVTNCQGQTETFTTDANGFFEWHFDVTTPTCDMTVEYTMPAGYCDITEGALSVTKTVPVNQVGHTVLGVEKCPPQVNRGVSGTVCNDINKDGICQQNETVISGVPVTIKTCAGDYNLLTDAKGNYNQDIQTPYGTIDCPVEIIIPDLISGYCERTTDVSTSLNIKPREYPHIDHGYIKCDSITILSYMPSILSGINKCQPMCYVVSDEDIENRSDTRGNSLYEVFLNDNTVDRISFTGTNDIEAIALVGNELYAIDGGTIGKIVNGKFVSIKQISKDADGLTYDGTYLYATVRVVGDSDYIVKMDLKGTIINRYNVDIRQFGQTDIDDIAFDGTLFYLIIGNSVGKHGTQLLTWKPGSNVTKVKDLPMDAEGLTISLNGDLIVTTGIEGTAKNRMFNITTGEEFNLEVSINGYAATDFESVDCMCR